MCISSLQHHKFGSQPSRSISSLLPIEPTPLRSIALGTIPHQTTKIKLSIRRERVHHLSIASLCLVLSATATVLECFSAFKIEYCDGEDLIQLYWGFWVRSSSRQQHRHPGRDASVLDPTW